MADGKNANESAKTKAARDALERAETVKKEAAAEARRAARAVKAAELAVAAAEREDKARRVLAMLAEERVVYVRPEEMGAYAEPDEKTFLDVLRERDAEAVDALFEVLGDWSLSGAEPPVG